MIRFGLTYIIKSGCCLSFQSILVKQSNTKLPRLLGSFSYSSSQQLNSEATIKSINPLCPPSQGLSSSIYYNLVSPTNRYFHTMNVARNKEQSSVNHSSSSGDNQEHGNDLKSQQGQMTIDANQPVDPKDKKGRFKVLIRDYGLTAVVFHVTISLASLGICYLLVNSSLPMDQIFTWLGIDKKLGNLSDAASTSTNFVVAYAVHKSMALIRLSITAACVPIIVRYLRSKGIIKTVGKVAKKVD
ncbi:protein FAM210B, mitochondrial-like [Panonychus citri]|uniref:protein FAM210B, mitochondrial-like n=1 Tax=Panonychus citri TaxID=50023 RepID=UPI002307718B|nr:protein FAM210B, mitochondrial-like [Panonychus citri]